MPDKTPGSEVTEEILKEIKSLGDNTEKNYAELNKSVHIIQDDVKRNEEGLKAIDTSKISKLAEDITLRQEALDKTNQENEAKLNTRFDKLEVFLKKMPTGDVGTGNISDLEKESIELQKCIMVAKGHMVNIHTEKAIVPNIEALKEHNEAANAFLRVGKENMGPDQVRALLAGSDADGGITVPQAMSSRIITRLFESDPIRSLAASERITSDSLDVMIDAEDTGAEWQSETIITTNQDTPTFKKLNIPVHELATRPLATQRLLEDSGMNIEQWLANKVADRFGRTESAAFVSGDGTGKPKGFLSYDSGAGFGKIEQVNMRAAAAITADGFSEIKYSLIEQYLNRGTWLMNRSTVLAALLLKDGTGQYIWRRGLSDKEPSTILGLPMRMSTSMPTIAANSLSVVLADFKEAYMIVDRLGITIQRDPFTKKPFIEFYTRKRVGGGATNTLAMKIGKIAV